MATYTHREVTHRIFEFIVPAPYAIGADKGEISKAWSGAEQKYRELHALPDDAQIADDQITFWPGDDEVIIRFEAPSEENDSFDPKQDFIHKLKAHLRMQQKQMEDPTGTPVSIEAYTDLLIRWVDRVGLLGLPDVPPVPPGAENIHETQAIDLTQAISVGDLPEGVRSSSGTAYR